MVEGRQALADVLARLIFEKLLPESRRSLRKRAPAVRDPARKTQTPPGKRSL
jgi:hypothetical protein